VTARRVSIGGAMTMGRLAVSTMNMLPTNND